MMWPVFLQTKQNRDSPEKNQVQDPCEDEKIAVGGTGLDVRGSSGCRGLAWAYRSMNRSPAFKSTFWCSVSEARFHGMRRVPVPIEQSTNMCNRQNRDKTREENPCESMQMNRDLEEKEKP